MERTFIAVKPEGVQRGLCGEVMTRFEKRGFQLVACKLVHASKTLLESHYEEHKGKGFFDGLVAHMSSSPVLAMVWEGASVISTARTMMGATDPKKSAPGTIRGDYGIDMGRNIIHGSDGTESATREINLWFTKEEQITWKPALSSWLYE
ncbi:nucleoside diphosphate kinase [Octopus sinensis]|uniref:nucleoside-diphosphate kinase n=1 Tax=Octopus sinensis TaxID=2607531 RepID=A0A6P7TQK0_9MOLL|nr:nucleoside diphosphate kinase [Octopus sinensis]